MILYSNEFFVFIMNYIIMNCIYNELYNNELYNNELYIIIIVKVI